MNRIFKLAGALGASTVTGMMAAPAGAQTLMPNFSFPEMRAVLTDLKATVLKEDVTDSGHRFIEAKTEDGLIFQVYGFECGDAKPTDTLQRCTGAELSADFTMAAGKNAHDAAAKVDYAAVSDDATSDTNLELRRYIIFDNGITPGNLKTNVQVYINITDKVWGYLTDNKFLN